MRSSMGMAEQRATSAHYVGGAFRTCSFYSLNSNTVTRTFPVPLRLEGAINGFLDVRRVGAVERADAVSMVGGHDLVAQVAGEDFFAIDHRWDHGDLALDALQRLLQGFAGPPDRPTASATGAVKVSLCRR